MRVTLIVSLPCIHITLPPWYCTYYTRRKIANESCYSIYLYVLVHFNPNYKHKKRMDDTHFRRGLLIVFEGIDRCGKSTQVNLLLEKLQSLSIPHVKYNFPNRETAIGKMIDSYLKQTSSLDDHAIHLLFSANRWEMIKTIEKDLLDMKHVILDRYAYSGVAFSSAKGLDMDWCLSPDKGLIRPDIIVHLDLTVDDAMKRGNFGDERYEKEEFQRKVFHEFEVLKREIKGQYDGPLWISVDANQSKESLHNEIYKLLEGHMLSMLEKKVLSLRPL